MTQYIFERLLIALEGAPFVVDSLLGGIDHNSDVWDFRPDVDRFTLREIVAHLADLEEVFLQRFELTLQSDDPQIPRIDSSKMIIANGYATAVPDIMRAEFAERRKEFIALLKTLSPEQWLRECDVPGPMGRVSLEFMAAFIAVHDGYHTGQIAQWLEKYKSQT